MKAFDSSRKIGQHQVYSSKALANLIGRQLCLASSKKISNLDCKSYLMEGIVRRGQVLPSHPLSLTLMNTNILA